VEAWWRVEGEAYVKINSDGLLDEEHLKQKPANTYRIAVLGDSQMEARQVPMATNFSTILEKELEKCSQLNGLQVETINFGVSDYGTAQELLTLRHSVWDYFPDLVVLGFITHNDIRNNSRALDGAPIRPYFVYQKDQLVLDDSFLKSTEYQKRGSLLFKWIYKILDQSRLLQVLREARNAVNREAKIRKMKDVLPDKKVAEFGLDYLAFKEPVNQDWIEAWRVTEGLITMTKDEVIARGAKFLTVTLSAGFQVNPDRSFRKSFMSELNIDNEFYPDLRIKHLGEKENFPVLMLAPEMQAYAEKHQVYFHGFSGQGRLGDGHWNESGHLFAGEMTSKYICENIF